MAKDPKDLVRQIVSQVGKQEARRLLVATGISISASDKLVGQRYANEVGLLVKKAIMEAYEMCKKRSA
jgi:hypothetical protein